jgi:hypothetical protein
MGSYCGKISDTASPMISWATHKQRSSSAQGINSQIRIFIKIYKKKKLGDAQTAQQFGSRHKFSKDSIQSLYIS